MVKQSLTVILRHMTFLWLAASIGMSHTASGQTYLMDPVYVSASRLSTTPGTSSRLVAVLDSAAIAQTGAHSIAELIHALPGVHARTRGPLGVQTDLAMAGATYSQVLVLVDGMRVNDPQTGHHTLNLPLRPQDLQRIEIVYGASSAVHGPDAFGGVVNLVPRSTPQRNATLSALWGDTKKDSDVAAVAQSASIRYGWNRAWGDLSISAGKERSDGYRDTTEFDIDRLFAQLRLPLKSGELKLSGGLEDKAFGAKDFYAPYPSKEWTRAWIGGAQYQRRFHNNRLLNSRLFYRRHRDRFVLWRDNPSAYENRHINETATLETHLLQPWRGGQVLWGGELSYLRIDSNNLGLHAQQRGALFAESSHPFDRVVLSTSARIDYSNTYDAEFSPSIRMAYRIKTGQIFLGIGRAFRAPSFTELHYTDPNNVGNPSLNAERAWSYEAGTEARLWKHLHIQGQTYLRRESNLVDYIRQTQTPPWRAQNLGQIRTVGALLNLSYRRWNAFAPSVSYAWNDKTRSLAEELESKYVFTQPRQRIGLLLTHRVTNGTYARWTYDFRQFNGGKSYGVAHVTLSRPMLQGQIRLRVDNLTNTRYEEVPGVPMPGRWFTVEMVSDL